MKKVYLPLACLSLLAFFTIYASDARSQISFSEEPFKTDNEALIYVYRLKSMVGRLVSWNVYIDKTVTGSLKQGNYMVLHVSPGTHAIQIGDTKADLLHIVVEAKAQNPDSFNAKANEAYFIRCKGTKVEFVAKEQAIVELSSMKKVSK